MKEITITNLKGRDLPAAWAKQAELSPDEIVIVTIRSEEPKETKRKVDWKAAEEIRKKFQQLPVLDSRTPDEIIGYNEYGVPE